MILAISDKQRQSFQHDPPPQPPPRPPHHVHLKEAMDRVYFPKYCHLLLKNTNAKGPEQPM